MMIICQLNIFLHVLNATIYWHIPWNIYCRPACCAWGQEPHYQAALRERDIHERVQNGEKPFDCSKCDKNLRS